MPEAGARMLPAADAAHFDSMKPYNSRFRIVLDIVIQVLFYLMLLAGFWLITFLMP